MESQSGIIVGGRSGTVVDQSRTDNQWPGSLEIESQVDMRAATLLFYPRIDSL
jgi:hypothetical protein